jgi:hypothetical protein
VTRDAIRVLAVRPVVPLSPDPGLWLSAVPKGDSMMGPFRTAYHGSLPSSQKQDSTVYRVTYGGTRHVSHVDFIIPFSFCSARRLGPPSSPATQARSSGSFPCRCNGASIDTLLNDEKD